MKKILIILFVLFSLQTIAQDTLTGKCWTPEMDTTEFQNQPWFGNNDYLEHFLDSKERTSCYKCQLKKMV